MVRIAKLDLFQVLRAERLLLHGSGHVGRDAHLLIGQGERRLPDDEMFARGESAPLDFTAEEKNRVVGIGQPRDLQFCSIPKQSGMSPRDLMVPRHGPNAADAPQDDFLSLRQRPPPALLSFDSLGDEVGHGRLVASGQLPVASG
jgi:hypothetical protein